MNKDTLLQNLLKRKDYWEEMVNHAIQNRSNPYADNGDQRLADCRLELARINEEIKSV